MLYYGKIQYEKFEGKDSWKFRKTSQIKNQRTVEYKMNVPFILWWISHHDDAESQFYLTSQIQLYEDNLKVNI